MFQTLSVQSLGQIVLPVLLTLGCSSPKPKADVDQDRQVQAQTLLLKLVASTNYKSSDVQDVVAA